MSKSVRPRRSVLYMPGSNARALEKARAIPADALILDLEDAVAPDAKDLARKIGVPDAVLFKQGKLTDEEWAVMRRHPVIGEQIILQAGDLQNVAQAVRSHHERWDGRGYPDGLSGRDIPYISRILAVCDSTDAMMSTRVYRPSLGREKCMRELADNAGTMYQRELADIFLENWDKIVGRLYEESVD